MCPKHAVLYAAAILLIVSIIPATGQISVSCVGERTPRVRCAVGNWTEMAVSPAQVHGTEINVTAYFSSLVQVSFNCTGNQLISPTSKEGYNTCNATVDPVTGRTYAVPASPLDPSVIENRHCLTVLMNKVEETLSFAPSNDTLESHYIINTIVNGSESSLNNHVGGACLRGVKILINIYRKAAPPVTPSASSSAASSATVASAAGSFAAASSAGSSAGSSANMITSTSAGSTTSQNISARTEENSSSALLLSQHSCLSRFTLLLVVLLVHFS